MYEIESRKNEIPSRRSLSKLGVSAVGFGAAGIFLLILGSASTLPGIILGALALLFGIGNIASKDPTDKKAGVLITAAGALTVVSALKIPLLAAVSGVLLKVSAIGLIALGVINAIRFFRGLKKHS